jgi:hypothetical protein
MTDQDVILNVLSPDEVESMLAGNHPAFVCLLAGGFGLCISKVLTKPLPRRLAQVLKHCTTQRVQPIRRLVELANSHERTQPVGDLAYIVASTGLRIGELANWHGLSARLLQRIVISRSRRGLATAAQGPVPGRGQGGSPRIQDPRN